MASLAVGEHARMYALAGVMRAGASRANYTSPQAFVAIAGIHYAAGGAVAGQQVDNDTLEIQEREGETPNTCGFRVRGFTPSDGQDVVITRGSKNNLERSFAGTTLRDTHSFTGTPANSKDTVSVVDYTWQLTRDQITARFTNVSGTIVAKAIIAVAAGRGFTSVRVQADLPVLDEITFTDATLAAALTQLCKRLGAYWKTTYWKDVRLGIGSDASQQDPLTLTAASALVTEMTDFSVTRDLSQVITRQPVEGGGVNALTDVAVGETILPVEDVLGWYNALGGLVACGPQKIAYTGVFVGGVGSIVGPALSPSVAPTPALAAGTGLGSGVYQYAFTDVTATGESLPSPLGSITTGPMTPPAAPSGVPVDGTGLAIGAYKYGLTFSTAGGETTMSPGSAVVNTHQVATPSSAPSVADFGAGGSNTFQAGESYQYAYTYVTPTGETAPSPWSAPFAVVHFGPNPDQNNAIAITVPYSTDPAVSYVRIYRTLNGGGTLYWVHNFFASGQVINYSGGGNATYVEANTQAGDAGAAAPGSNTANVQKVAVAAALGPSGTTARSIYRTDVNGSTYKLVTTIADNTTGSYLDAVPDASLGAAPPVSNTAALNQVALSGIALGPTGTTSRKLYRTAVSGSQLKLQQTIANNTATVGVTDATADGSLGANAPTADTSGLSTTVGQINAGSATVLTAGAGPFSATGGWFVNGQQVVRYTGITGNTLTGIPVTGPGAITTTMLYGSQIIAAPALLGIPASGVGSILYAIKPGDPVNLRVVVNDLPAQAILTALMLPAVDDGIITGDLIQDGRISETEARARGLATITARSQIAVSISYDTHDPQTHAGRTIGVADILGVTGSFKIQAVTISNFAPARMPRHHVEASSSRFTFEDLVRMARKGL